MRRLPRGFQRTAEEEEEAEEGWLPDAHRHRGVGGGHAQDEVTLKGVNADWAKATPARSRANTLTAEGPDGLFC